MLIKHLASWNYSIYGKDLNFIREIYFKLVPQLKLIFIPKSVSISPQIANINVNDWESLDKKINSIKDVIYSIRFDEVSFINKLLSDEAKKISNVNVLYLSISQNSSFKKQSDHFITLNLHLRSDIFLNPQLFKMVSDLLNRCEIIMGCKPKIESEVTDKFEVSNFGIRKKTA